MLEGFGQAPVSLELDLDSYDGPPEHVARFRGRSGWLTVAEARLRGASNDSSTTIVAAVDEQGHAIPGFMAGNLVNCACSLPEPCHDYPPDELDLALGAETLALKKRWLREHSQSLRELDDATERRLAEMEARAQLRLDTIDREIADLRRRRRMGGVTPHAAGIFLDRIRELEELQDFVLEQLRQDRLMLREDVARAERRLFRRVELRVAVDPLYVVSWRARPSYHEDMELALEQMRWVEQQAGSLLVDPRRKPGSISGEKRLKLRTLDPRPERRAPVRHVSPPVQRSDSGGASGPNDIVPARAIRVSPTTERKLRRTSASLAVEATRVLRRLSRPHLSSDQVAKLRDRHIQCQEKAADLKNLLRELPEGHRLYSVGFAALKAVDEAAAVLTSRDGDCP